MSRTDLFDERPDSDLTVMRCDMVRLSGREHAAHRWNVTGNSIHDYWCHGTIAERDKCPTCGRWMP